MGKAFGTGKIIFEPVAGEVTDVGRSLIRIHGGGSAARDPYDSGQGLYHTEGCVRCSNGEINNLIADINELANDADPLFRVFIGSQEYLTKLASPTDRNNNYLYPELRAELGLFKDGAEKETLLRSYQQMLESEMKLRQKLLEQEIERRKQRPRRL